MTTCGGPNSRIEMKGIYLLRSCIAFCVSLYQTICRNASFLSGTDVAVSERFRMHTEALRETFQLNHRGIPYTA